MKTFVKIHKTTDGIFFVYMWLLEDNKMTKTGKKTFWEKRIFQKKDNAVVQIEVTPSIIGFCQILYSREEHLLHIFENRYNGYHFELVTSEKINILYNFRVEHLKDSFC